MRPRDLCSFTVFAAVLATTAAACSWANGPSAPTTGALVVPDVLAPSMALLDKDSQPLPYVGEPAGVWVRRLINGIVLDDTLPAGVRAQCCGADRLVRWSTAWLPDPSSHDDVRVAAALLLHEARHAEGYPHSCPDERRDRTVEEGGAWAVHAAWLELAGDVRMAQTIRALDIGCR